MQALFELFLIFFMIHKGWDRRVHCIRLAGECSQCQRHLNSVTGGKGDNVLSVRLLQQRGLQDKWQQCSGAVTVSFKCHSKKERKKIKNDDIS